SVGRKALVAWPARMSTRTVCAGLEAHSTASDEKAIARHTGRAELRRFFMAPLFASQDRPRGRWRQTLATSPGRLPGVSGKSEIELQGQLQLTGTADGAGDEAVVAGTHVGVGTLKVRVVEGVEGLRAELQAHSFAQHPERELFEQRHRHVAGSGHANAADGP